LAGVTRHTSLHKIKNGKSELGFKSGLPFIYVNQSMEPLIFLFFCHFEERFCDEKSCNLLIYQKTSFLASLEMTISYN